MCDAWQYGAPKAVQGVAGEVKKARARAESSYAFKYASIFVFRGASGNIDRG